MSYERLDHCPVCGKTDIKNFLIIKDYSVSGEDFVVTECENCSFKFTNPRPDQESIGKYYESEEYISHSNTNKGLVNKAYQAVRLITTKQKIKLINRLSKNKGRLLDYGCGTGFFLAAAAKDGWAVDAFEPNTNARLQAEQNIGKKIESETLNNFEKETFDVITLWHVLEHVHQLNETFGRIVELAKRGSYIVVAVPNIDSLDARTYKENWAAYDVPRHLYHFNQKTMKRFLKKHKLDVVEVLPMKFDAYYVSILSERYKNSSNNILNSIISGFKSNYYASKNENDYSSLIYVAYKK